MPFVRVPLAYAQAEFLPPLCMHCGDPRAPFTRMHTYSYTPGWAYLLGGLILGSLMRKNHTMRLRFCEACSTSRGPVACSSITDQFIEIAFPQGLVDAMYRPAPPPPPPAIARAPGGPVSPGPLPAIPVDFAMPPMLWGSQAAAVLAEAQLPLELAVEIQGAQGSFLIPVVCRVGQQKWAPYFEPDMWTPQALDRLLQTVAAVRTSEHADLRFQVYGPCAPPPWVLDCLQGGPLPSPGPVGTAPRPGSPAPVAGHPIPQPGAGRVHPLLWAGLATAVVLLFYVYTRPPAPVIKYQPLPPPAPRVARSDRTTPAVPGQGNPTATPSPLATVPPPRPGATPPPSRPPRPASVAPVASPPRPPAQAAPPVDDLTRLTPTQQRDLTRIILGKRVPGECLPKEVAPPGIEGAWTVSDPGSAVPTELKNCFKPGDPVGLTILERRILRGQQIRVLLYRQGVASPLVQQLEVNQRHDTIDYLGFRIPPSPRWAPGAYRFDITLDGKLVKTVPFTVAM